MMMTSPLERRITLHQLRIFKTVVDLQGFTRAADALALTQSAVGAAVHERAGRILALVRETGDLLDDITGLRTGTVRVAGDTTVGIYVLPDALASFREQHPSIELSLEVVNRKRVRELLLSGDADIGVAGRLWDDELVQAEPLMENALMCFSALDHPLVKQEPLQPADLLKGPLLLRELGSGTRESAEAILREHGVEPKPAMQLASNGALKRAVARGLGVSVLSTHAVTLELKVGLLHPLRTPACPVTRLWHVVWARERVLSPAAQAFRQHLQSPEWRMSLTAQLGTD